MNKENNINIEKLEKLINLYVEEVGEDYFILLKSVKRELITSFNYVKKYEKEKQFELLREDFTKLYSHLKRVNFCGISELSDYLHNLIVYKDDTKYLEQINNGRNNHILIGNTIIFYDEFIDENKTESALPYLGIKKQKYEYEKILGNDKINKIYDSFELLEKEHILTKRSNLLYGDFVRWKENKFLKIKIENYFTIKNVELTNFNSKEIYLLGENGAGKTILLQNILFQLKGTNFFKTKKTTDVSQIIDVFKSENINYENKIFSDVLAYGVNRNNLSRGLKESFEFMTLFSNEYKLRNPIDWLIKIYNIENDPKTDTKIKKEDAIKMLSDLLDGNVEIEVDSTNVKFTEKGKSIDFYSLADGYKSVFTWVMDMISRFSETQPYITKLQHFKGTVLIDELDLFLHPKWAYKIMAKLRGWFPRVRFIISTHSPVLILGASKDAIIYKVSKNENGETEVSEPYEFKNYQNLTSNAFLTAPFMFDMEFSGTREMKDTDFYKNKLDTSGHFNIYKIHKAVEKRVKEIREEQNVQISELDIENWINDAIAKQEEGKK